MRSGFSNASQAYGVSRSRRSSVKRRRRTGKRSKPCGSIRRTGSRNSNRWARSGRWRGRNRSRSVAEAWREAQAHLNAHGQPRSVLVICATHDDIAHVTAAIRAERHQAGELGEGIRVDRYVPLHYTLAQRSDPGQFHAGQVLVFHADTPEVRRHEALEIVRVEPHQLVARTEAGEEHVITNKQAQALNVYRAAADRDCAARSPPAHGQSAGAELPCHEWGDREGVTGGQPGTASPRRWSESPLIV